MAHQSIRRLGEIAPLALLAALFALSCLSDPSGPAYQTGYLALAPSFESSAAGIVDVESIHVILERDEDGTTALDTVVALTTESETVDLSFTVLVASSSETFTLTLQCLSPTGDTVFSAGPQTVTASTSGGDDVVVETVTLDYVGTGYDAAEVRIVSTDVIVDFGEATPLVAEVLDSSGAVIEGTPIEWISHDTDRAVIPDRGVGQVVGGVERGLVHVEAKTLTGQADTIDVMVEPVPSAIAVVAGNNQTGVANTMLTDSIVVQVNAVDGPIEGVTVNFATDGDGSFSQNSAVTNADGYAWTWWTLGASAGTQTATATVTSLPTIQASITAIAGGLPGGIRWVTSTGGNWSDPSNWDLGRVPTSTDTVYITEPSDTAGEGGYAVIVDVDASVASLSSGVWVSLILDVGRTLAIDSLTSIDGSLTMEDGSTLTGAGDITVGHRITWRGGSTIAGTGVLTIADSAELNLPTATSTRFLDGRSLENFGEMRWGPGDVVLSDGATIANHSTMLITGLAIAVSWDSVGAEPRIENWGIWTQENLGAVTEIGIPILVHDGVLEITGRALTVTSLLASDTARVLVGGGALAGTRTQTLSFSNGTSQFGIGTTVVVSDSGVFHVGAGADVLVEGSFDQSGGATWTDIEGGTATFNSADTVRLANLSLANGSTTSGSLLGSAVVFITDSAHFASGTMGDTTGVTSIADTATLLLMGSDSPGITFDLRTIDNAGHVVYAGDDVFASTGTVFNNLASGTFEFRGDHHMRGGAILNNDGLVVKTEETSPASPAGMNWEFNNRGVLDVQIGEFAFGSLDPIFFAGSVVQGAGTVDVFDVTATFAGNVNPGTSPGMLHLSGDFAQTATSTVNIELNGTTLGTDYDQLFFESATLNGSMAITTGFTPSIGDRFTVLTFGSRTGNFASISGLDIGGGMLLDTIWGASSLVLEVVDATPAVSPHAGLVAWWPGDGSTTDIQSGFDGTWVGTAAYATGQVDQAFSFDGTNEVSVPDDELWNLGDTPFTMEMWVNLTTVQTVNPFLGHTEGPFNVNKWVFTYEYGLLRFHINSPTLGPTYPVEVTWSPSTGQWYHVAVTRNGSAYALYIDGAEVATSTNATTVPDPAAPLTIGRSEAFYLDGLVDELTGYDLALDATDIQAIYNAGANGKRKDQVPLTTINSWTNAAGGSWSEPLNWSLGRAPTPNDVVDITLNDTYTVSVDDATTVSVMDVGGTSGIQTLSVSGQTLTVYSSATFGTNGVLEFSGGTVDGIGNINVNGSMNWTGGSLNVTGVTTIGSGGSATLTGPTAKYYRYGTLDNSGSIVQSDGPLYSYDGFVNNLAGGTFEMQGAVLFDRQGGGGSGTFSNAGTLTKTGAGTTNISLPFDNATTGTVSIMDDTLRFSRGATLAGDLSIPGGTTIYVPTSTLTIDTSLVGGGSIQLGGGANLTHNGTYSLPHLVAPGGTLVFNGPVTATDSVVVTGATVTFNSTLATPPFLRFTGGTIGGTADISVADSLIWSGGNLNTTGTTTIASGDSLRLTGPTAKYYRYGTLYNSGAIVQSEGPLYSYDGDVNNLAGSTFEMQGAVLFDRQGGGGTGVFNNAGTLTKTGTGIGNISLPFDNAATGTVDIQQDTVRFSRGSTLGGDLSIPDGTTLSLYGSTHTIDTDLVGAGSVQFYSATVTHTGTYSLPHLVAPNGTIVFNGPVTASDSLVVSGATVTFNSTLTAPPFLRFNSGTIDGTADISVVDSLIWGSGNLNTTGTTTIASGDSLRLTGPSGKYFRYGTLNNSGAIVQSEGPLYSYDGFVNNLAGGTFEMQGAVLFDRLGGGGSGVFNNAGTLTKTGAGIGNISLPFDNAATGTVDIQQDTVRFSRGSTLGGDLSIPDGTTLSLYGSTHTIDTSLVGAGSVQFYSTTVTHTGTYLLPHLVAPNGTIVFNGPVTASDSLVVSGATVTFNSTLTAPPFLRLAGGIIDGTANIAVVDSLIWGSGNLNTTGTTTIASGDSLLLRGTGGKYYRYGTLYNSGAIVLSEGPLYSYDGDVNNLVGGTFEMQGAVLFDRQGGGGTGVLNNAGTLTKTGTGTAALGMPLTNTGTLDAQAGTLDVNRTFTHADAAVIQGTSTLDIASATYSSLSGDFEPNTGEAVGTLAITGNLPLDANSALNIDVSGTNPGEYDVIAVSGNVTVDGTININAIGAYSPSPGDMITIMTWTGTLTDNTITAPPGWIPIVTSSDIQLEYTG